MSKNIRHISIKHHFLKDLIEEKKINLKFTPSTSMWADFLTKLVPTISTYNVARTLGFSTSPTLKTKIWNFNYFS
mgnify:CR=1 FL=1